MAKKFNQTEWDTYLNRQKQPSLGVFLGRLVGYSILICLFLFAVLGIKVAWTGIFG